LGVDFMNASDIIKNLKEIKLWFLFLELVLIIL
jgi:hypothetical protein